MKQERQLLEAQIAKMRSDFEFEERSSLRGAHEVELQEEQFVLDREEMGRVRGADAIPAAGNGRA